VTQFMVDMVNPMLGEVILDPACGTGGFLVCALEYLRKQVKNEQDQATLQRSVRGVEKKQLPHMLCTTNMMLHGVEVPSQIAHDNTLIRLPNGVFAPYTGIKTNLLFFTKGQPTKDIWYYEHQYPSGVKNYNKTKPIRIEEFDVEKAWWGSEADGFASRVENAFAWKVSIEQIKAANFNLDQKNPHAADVVSHDPEQLLADYARLQAEAQALRDELKGILAQSLSSAG